MTQYHVYQCPLCSRRYPTAAAAAQGWTCCGGARLQAVSVAKDLPSAAPIRLELYDITPGRDSMTAALGAENLFATLGTTDPYSLEICSTHTGHRFLVRAPSTIMAQVLEPIRSIYPQASTRPLSCAQPGDPAFVGPDEVLVAAELRLERPAYLPLRTFQRDDDFAVADPLAGILGSQARLGPGERVLVQIILRPAAPDWGSQWVHLIDENPFATAPAMRTVAGNLRAFLVIWLLACGGGGAALGGLRLLAGHWLTAGLIGGGMVALCVPALWAIQRLGRRAYVDPRLVREKLSSGPAFQSWIRLLVIGSDQRRLLPRLHQVAAAYRQIQHGMGNNLRLHALPDDVTPYDLYTDPRAWSLPGGRQVRSPWRKLPLLTARELAALWHLPHRDVELQLLPRSSYKRILPPLPQVQEGITVGREEHLGHAVTVRLALPDLHQHTLMVGKTRRGKSTLMGHLIDAAIQSGDRAILVVDPHADLVRGILGRVPRAHRDRVVYLDLSDESRPVGLNLLDVHTGRSRARIVDNLMTNFSRIWRDYWGPRMADIFRFSLAALLEANGQLADQLSLLDVAGLLTDAKLRNYVLQRVTDAHVLRWWDEQTRIMHDNPRWWGEIIRPVQDKINFFTLYPVTRHIFGQPDTTLDLTALIQAGQVILVNTAAGIVGAESSALVGATLVDVVADFLRSQAGQSAAVERCRVMVVVDEFHTIPADYEGFTAELAKYGGHLVLGTQSLRRLDVMDQALRPVVFSNISNLFVFQTSAADAEELVGELDEAMTETDLVNLADHACYVKTSRRGQRLPVFSMSTLAPAAGDPATAAAIAAASGERYGRPLDEVQRRIQTLMLERYEPWRGRGGSQGERLDEMPATQQDPTGLDVAPTMGN